MKIDHTRRVSSSQIRKAGKSGSASSTEFARLLEEQGETSGPVATRAAGPVDSLYAIQEAGGQGGDAADEQARRHGEAMLERLEAIRDGLLMGTIPISQLRDLTRTVKTQRQGFVDPRLASVLDDIELRARVELAKLGLDA